MMRIKRMKKKSYSSAKELFEELDLEDRDNIRGPFYSVEELMNDLK